MTSSVQERGWSSGMERVKYPRPTKPRLFLVQNVIVSHFNANTKVC